jgi:hypothetical protein
MEPEAFTYLDDIVIATETFEVHQSKFCIQLWYLGYLFDSRGLHPDPEKNLRDRQLSSTEKCSRGQVIPRDDRMVLTFCQKLRETSLSSHLL